MSTSTPMINSNGIDNGNNTIRNVADPVNPQDAATKAFATNASNLATGTVPSVLLAASGVTAGSYGAATGSIALITVDAKGRVTSAASTPLTALPAGVQAPGLLISTLPSITAAGTNQATATAVSGDFNIITSSAAGTGVILPTAASGKKVDIVNQTANAVLIYPAVGASIDALIANTAISLGAGGRMTFISPSAAMPWVSNASTKLVGDGSLLTNAGPIVSSNIPLAPGIVGSSGVGSRVSADDHVHPAPSPVILQTAIPVGVMGCGQVGANGFLFIPNAYAFFFTYTFSNLFTTYYNSGAWLRYPAGAVYSGSPAGFFWTVIGNNMLSGTLAGGSGYTSGVYTNVALTGGAGTGAQATIVIVGGVVTAIGITNAGTGYAATNVLSASTVTIGAGTGFTFTITNAYVYASASTVTGVGSGTLAGGSGYTNGVYTNVPLPGGSGAGAMATITIVGGVVVGILITAGGTGYSTGNTLTAATGIMGAGTGFGYSAIVLGGPMTGTVYNNTYNPGTNTGAWSSTNLSLSVPAPGLLVPFTGTQGTPFTGSNLGESWPLIVARVPAGVMNVNSSIVVKFAHSAGANAAGGQKALIPTVASALTGGTSYGNMNVGTSISTTNRQVVASTWYNRGVANLQYSAANDIVSAGNGNIQYTNVPTGSDFYVRFQATQYVPTGVGSQATLAGGTGYTTGTYLAVPLTGGAGTGVLANITVNGSGVVTACQIVIPGSAYVIGNALTCATSIIGAGTGFTYTITNLASGDWSVLEYASLKVDTAPV